METSSRDRLEPLAPGLFHSNFRSPLTLQLIDAKPRHHYDDCYHCRSRFEPADDVENTTLTPGPLMLNLISVLAILFLALFVIVSLLEKYGRRHSSEEVSKLSRLILPLIALVIVLQAVRYFFMG